MIIRGSSGGRTRGIDAGVYWDLDSFPEYGTPPHLTSAELSRTCLSIAIGMNGIYTKVVHEIPLI